MLLLSSAEKLRSPERRIDVILVSLFSNIGDDSLNLKQVLPFTRKSWTVEKEVIQCFHIKTTNTNKIKCD